MQCYCGEEVREVPCGWGRRDEKLCGKLGADGEEVIWSGRFQCGKACKGVYDCGIHPCELVSVACPRPGANAHNSYAIPTLLSPSLVRCRPLLSRIVRVDRLLCLNCPTHLDLIVSPRSRRVGTDVRSQDHAGISVLSSVTLTTARLATKRSSGPVDVERACWSCRAMN